ncbi:UTP9 [Candida oxycetoniae]|uniref:UTP9 n=1 Tax=Candida oxycetoniae TaxID=497107 RepID=A0AAI9WW53_9ASCO|nr:UTP9 [Candida oxycetoniae]KAI3402860.1 UTP9 [Candida oxycetoniae]
MDYCIHGERIAKVVSRNEKNEIQFYELSSSGEYALTGSVFLDKPVLDFKFKSDDDNKGDTSNTKNSKKRTMNGDETILNGDAKESLLAVLLEDKSIVIISPLSNSIVRKINIDKSKNKAIAVVSYQNDTIWASTESQEYLLKISTNADNKISKFNVPKYTAICITKNSEVCFGTASTTDFRLEIGKLLKSKYSKVKEIDLPQEIKSVEPLCQHYFVILTLSQKVYILSTETEKLKQLECQEEVEKIQVLHLGEEKYIIGVMHQGLTIFASDGSCINSINMDQMTDQPIDHVFSLGNVPFISWQVENTLHFKAFSITQNETIELKNGTGKSLEPNNDSASVIDLPDVKKISGMDTIAILKGLHILLCEPSLDKNKVIQYTCSSIIDTEAIKQIISSLTHEQSEKLYTIISEEVAKNVNENHEASLWLQWILLLHGGALAHISSVSVKNLQNQLQSGLKIMPHLYAIKGKLELLQLQSQLRSNTSLGDDYISTTVENESILYANGEVDDTFALIQ